ncbi:hypothetical protein LG296_20035 (plasmid) [Ureibacillus chungkukjangi]|uniref:hypothetical protein n=1 Tax=Ureibacillus chungkukjangi TaxID=1202712 RepID=UPI000D3D8774|nr:hypothetical protein [Ureibacillus chungkukjangi]
MLEQISFLEILEEKSTEPPTPMGRLEVIEEPMETQQNEEDYPSKNIEELHIGQKVRIIYPSDENCEIYQYLNYYFPHLKSKICEISSIKEYKSGKTYELDYKGDKVLLNKENVEPL